MGKGDRKTRRGKTYRGSYGRSRLHQSLAASTASPAVSAAKPAAVKKKT